MKTICIITFSPISPSFPVKFCKVQNLHITFTAPPYTKLPNHTYPYKSGHSQFCRKLRFRICQCRLNCFRCGRRLKRQSCLHKLNFSLFDKLHRRCICRYRLDFLLCDMQRLRCTFLRKCKWQNWFLRECRRKGLEKL